MKRRNVDLARALRRESTDAEKRLCRKLRDHRIADCKFVRQVPIGPYIVDFACRRKKVIIEVDGGQHAECQADEVRTRFLQKRGYHVLRFWNNDVLQKTDGVLTRIAEALSELPSPPHPDPLPVGERESDR